jgi:hypothetical protein
MRAMLEAAWFGKPGPDDAAPIYGAIQFHGLPPNSADWYGDAAVYLKRHVFERTTVTVGDSLHREDCVRQNAQRRHRQ